MSYIKQEKRDVLDPAIEELLNALRELESDDPNNNTESNIKYVIARVLKQVYSGGDDRAVNDAGGLMLNAYLEFYRKVAVPLADQEEFDNGKVE